MGAKSFLSKVMGASRKILERNHDVTQDHVIWAYRLFLDREPENMDVVEAKLANHPDTRSLRNAFMTSSEFKNGNTDMMFVTGSNIVIKQFHDNLRLFVDLNDFSIGPNIIKGVYEKDETAFVKQIVREGDTVVDMGANIGYFTIIMAELTGPHGHVYSIEPIPRNAEMIRMSVSENRFQERVDVIQAAASGQAGSINIFFDKSQYSSGGAFILANGDETPVNHDTMEVKTITLDDLEIKRPVKFIKIDVEGAEPQALAGARETITRDKPVIMSEVFPDQLRKVSGVNEAEYIQQIEAMGYKARNLDRTAYVKKLLGENRRVKTMIFTPL
ncbi:MAG: FkbM family methyltransferase [Nitrospinota bacterium]|nr:FkbM family methyltransferase [Nitrospinota bacterium]MDH5677493.1 FkbM family methyltransferase [Nitrospinota bacterium]MDH5757620.1 FkbM family methyltransferase [Nitrospinota bacterium]